MTWSNRDWYFPSRMEIVIGEGERSRCNNLSEARDNLVRNSLFEALLMMFTLILDRHVVDGVPPAPWGAMPAVASEREYQEMVLMEIARRQRQAETFLVVLDVLGETGKGLPLRLERWRLVSTGYHTSPQGDSLSTDVVRILNRRLMTLTRTIFALTMSHLSGDAAGFPLKFCLHDEDGDAHGWRKPLNPKSHKVSSHQHSSSSISVSVAYFSDEELEEVLLAPLSSQSLPVSPFDECIVLHRHMGANVKKKESETVNLVTRTMAGDALVSDFFLGEGQEDEGGEQAQVMSDRIQSHQAFFSALPRPSTDDKTKV